MQFPPNFESGWRLQDGSILLTLQRWLNFGAGTANGFAGLRFYKSPAPTALTVTAALTAAQLINAAFTANQGGGAVATYTLPTVALLNAALPADFAVDDAFDFTLINISTVAAEDVTIATAAGWTLVGNMTVNSNDAITSISSARFRARKTAATTFTLYRIT